MEKKTEEEQKTQHNNAKGTDFLRLKILGWIIPPYHSIHLFVEAQL